MQISSNFTQIILYTLILIFNKKRAINIAIFNEYCIIKCTL